MNLKITITDMLAPARKVVTDGAEVIPAWRITTPEGQFLVLTRFDPAKPEQASRILKLVQRFMAWRWATSSWRRAGFARTRKQPTVWVGDEDFSHPQRA